MSPHTPARWLGRALGLGVLLALAGGLWVVGGSSLNPTRPPQNPNYGPLPPITALNDEGQPFAGWQSLPQPALMVTLWASWCPVCMAELPAKLAYVQTHPQVALVAISIDTDPAAMARARQKLKATPNPRVLWLHDADRTRAFMPLQASGVPETFVANAQRMILAKQNGPVSLTYGAFVAALAEAQKPPFK